MMWHDRTHCANSLTKGSREGVDDIHSGGKPLFQSLIAALRLIHFVGLPFQYGEDRFRRTATSYLLCKRVCNKILFGLLLVLAQSLVKDGLRMGVGGGRLETGRHDLALGLREVARRGRRFSGHKRAHCLMYVANHRSVLNLGCLSYA